MAPVVATDRWSGRTALAGVVLTAASYAAVRTDSCGSADAWARERFAARGGPGDGAVAVLTDLGSVYGAGGVSAALAACGRRRLAAGVAAGAATAWCLAQAVKPALDRRRPYEEGWAARLVSPPAGSSWPSGHTAVVSAVALHVAPAAGPAARAGLAVVVAGVGVSRLTVGVHHLSDVVAGLGIGAVAAATSRVAVRLLGGRRPGSRTNGARRG